MTARTAELLSAALQLPEDERAELVERLDESLTPPGSDIDRMTEEEFAAELARRHEEYLRDPSVGIPLEEVLRKAEQE